MRKPYNMNCLQYSHSVLRINYLRIKIKNLFLQVLFHRLTLLTKAVLLPAFLRLKANRLLPHARPSLHCALRLRLALLPVLARPPLRAFGALKQQVVVYHYSQCRKQAQQIYSRVNQTRCHLLHRLLNKAASCASPVPRALHSAFVCWRKAIGHQRQVLLQQDRVSLRAQNRLVQLGSVVAHLAYKQRQCLGVAMHQMAQVAVYSREVRTNKDFLVQCRNTLLMKVCARRECESAYDRVVWTKRQAKLRAMNALRNNLRSQSQWEVDRQDKVTFIIDTLQAQQRMAMGQWRLRLRQAQVQRAMALIAPFRNKLHHSFQRMKTPCPVEVTAEKRAAGTILGDILQEISRDRQKVFMRRLGQKSRRVGVAVRCFRRVEQKVMVRAWRLVQRGLASGQGGEQERQVVAAQVANQSQVQLRLYQQVQRYKQESQVQHRNTLLTKVLLREDKKERRRVRWAWGMWRRWGGQEEDRWGGQEEDRWGGQEEDRQESYDINNYEIKVEQSGEKSPEVSVGNKVEQTQDDLAMQYLVYLEQKNNELKQQLLRLDQDKETMYRIYDYRKKQLSDILNKSLDKKSLYWTQQQTKFS